MNQRKMTSEELRECVINALHQVAPDANLQSVNPDAPLRDELEIDSMDFLRFAVLLHENLHIDVPESDYRKLATLNSCVDYLYTKINDVS